MRPLARHALKYGELVVSKGKCKEIGQKTDRDDKLRENELQDLLVQTGDWMLRNGLYTPYVEDEAHMLKDGVIALSSLSSLPFVMGLIKDERTLANMPESQDARLREYNAKQVDEYFALSKQLKVEFPERSHKATHQVSRDDHRPTRQPHDASIEMEELQVAVQCASDIFLSCTSACTSDVPFLSSLTHDY